MLEADEYIDYIIDNYIFLLSIGHNSSTAINRIKEEGLYLKSPNAHYDEGYDDGYYES